MTFVSMSKALYQPPPSSQHCWLLLQGKLQALVCRTAALGRKVPLAMVAKEWQRTLPFSPAHRQAGRGSSAGKAHIAWSIPVTAPAPKPRHSWPEGQPEGAWLDTRDPGDPGGGTSCCHRVEGEDG